MNELAPGCSSRSSAFISSCSEHGLLLPGWTASMWSSSPPAWQQFMYKPAAPLSPNSRLCCPFDIFITHYKHFTPSSSASRLQPKHQSGSRCHLVNLPSDITPTPLHPTCAFTSSLVHCAALGFWHQEIKPAHIHYFHLLQFHLSTRLMFFYPFSLVFLYRQHCSSVLSVGITGHTDFVCYSHPHLTPICCTTFTFLCFLTSSHSITGLASALLYIFCRWETVQQLFVFLILRKQISHL